MSNRMIHTIHEPLFRYLMGENALSQLIPVATVTSIPEVTMTAVSSCGSSFWHIILIYINIMYIYT